MQKNEAQISRFALLGKAPILWKKFFEKKKKKKKKILYSLFVQIISSKFLAEIFLK